MADLLGGLPKSSTRVKGELAVLSGPCGLRELVRLGQLQTLAAR
jgi:hypothetical protein